MPLGSPKNTFGTGDLLAGSDRENFWAAVSGYCAGHESGDNKLAKYESYSQSSSTSACQPNGSPASDDDYDPDGYLYAIDLPTNQSSLKLDVYDGEYNRRADRRLPQDSGWSTTRPSRRPSRSTTATSTPLDLSNLTLLTTTLNVNTNSSTYHEQWATALHVDQPQGAGSTTCACSPTPPARDHEQPRLERVRAPRVHGQLVLDLQTISTASNYSGELSPAPRGERHVDLRQPSRADRRLLPRPDRPHPRGQDDADQPLRLRRGREHPPDPRSQRQPDTVLVEHTVQPTDPPTGTCTGTATAPDPKLDVSGSGTQPYTGLISPSKYNDRFITIDIPLPPNYTRSTRTWRPAR